MKNIHKNHFREINFTSFFSLWTTFLNFLGPLCMHYTVSNSNYQSLFQLSYNYYYYLLLKTTNHHAIVVYY